MEMTLLLVKMTILCLMVRRWQRQMITGKEDGFSTLHLAYSYAVKITQYFLAYLLNICIVQRRDDVCVDVGR